MGPERGFLDNPTYEIIDDDRGKAIKCLICGRTSWHPEDVCHRYCGACMVFHEDLAIAGRVMERRLESSDEGPAGTG